jgi:hypothetical protein
VKSRGFLEQHGLSVQGETVDAAKVRKGRAGALALARSALTVVVGKGKKVLTFDMKANPPDEETLAQAILGPTGNLKAPTLSLGGTLLVGFSEAAHRQVLQQ